MSADLLSILGNAPRLPEAACRGQGGAFDSRQPDENDTEAAYRHRAAAAVCHGCGAQTACLAWLKALPPHHRPSGVVAGLMVDNRGHIEPLGGNTEAAS